MRYAGWVFSFLAALVLTATIAPAASSLDGGTVFSLKPGTGYKCVYVSLPQDLGVDSLGGTTESVIEIDRSESPWADMTYNKVVMEEGSITRTPVCFYYADREEGEFSFYNIRLSSEDLGVSDSISGGLCVSSYEDVDTGLDAGNTTNVCDLLNENADIIDLSFVEETTPADPGEVVTKKLYVTSYANLRIRLSVTTDLQNDLGEPVVTTSPSKPTAMKTFKVKAPEREGEFVMTVHARAEGCGLQACRKAEKGVISVSGEEKEGFSVSVIPGNINLKEPGETLFRVVISNRGETRDFTIEPGSDPEATMEPLSKTVNVEKGDEKTSIFKLATGDEDLYEISFRVTDGSTEKLMTSYVSVGELLNDAYRYSEEQERKAATSDLKEEIRRAREEYEERYESSSYGGEVSDYEDFRDRMEQISNKADGGEDDNGQEATEEPATFGFMIWAVPLIIVVVVILLFVAYKKSSGSGDTGPSYGGYR